MLCGAGFPPLTLLMECQQLELIIQHVHRDKHVVLRISAPAILRVDRENITLYTGTIQYTVKLNVLWHRHGCLLGRERGSRVSQVRQIGPEICFEVFGVF